MNAQLQEFARTQIKAGLEKLPEGWQLTFWRMYAPRGTVASVKAMTMRDIVDQMPAEKLDWALSQVERSLRKLEERPGETGALEKK